ncbi:MAG TPA: glycoside hydrolase 100 family protein [Sedimentisphaerales bacterium]|nr:glycoside hydrolase 100 family protein [Sedimentisphaerales bacterium]
MKKQDKTVIEQAKHAAVEVLLYNANGPYDGLFRTAAWGYPEPYTRDLMIASLGILVSGNKRLIKSLRRVLETAAKNQSPLGQIPSLVHDPGDCGSSDCTALFLMAAAIFRQATGQRNFLRTHIQKSVLWMEYQCSSDILVGQLPTSDWRDEQWVLGYGLFVNTVVYTYLRLLGQNKRACRLRDAMGRLAITAQRTQRHVHEGLLLKRKPYYALWSYKVYRSERFDLLGNSLAILTGIAPASRAKQIISWVEKECEHLRKNRQLTDVNLPPNLFPYIRPQDPDWMPRYKLYNLPGEYHNGGIWPFVCGFYIAALVAAGKQQLAEKRLISLTSLVSRARRANVKFGFNEWHKAQNGSPEGRDWQTWSAAMYLYAAHCVENKTTPFFDKVRHT